MGAALSAAGIDHSLRPSRRAADYADVLGRADVVLLAVPDDAVATVADGLVAALPAGHLPAVVHLSGVLGLDALAAAERHGCAVGSLHPCQSFATVRPPEALVGVTFAIEAGTADLEARLVALSRALGGVPRVVAAADRPAYHASAVLASAGIVALASQARDLLTGVGWNEGDALAALLPLMRSAVEGLAEQGLPGALTGPWRRGDIGTVARHRATLGAAPAAETYVALAREGLELGLRLGLDDQAYRELQATLDA